MLSATGMLVLCLTAWVGLAVNLCIAAPQGLGGVEAKLLHLLGGTNQFGAQSWSAVIWHLGGLLLLTAAAGYFRRSRRADPINP
jgi:uncharacterized membrane protein YbhN (UPF0104 family)